MYIDPGTVGRGGAITVTVASFRDFDLLAWFLRVAAARDNSVVMHPRVLEAHATPSDEIPGGHDCEIKTIGFEPGEYYVDLSYMGTFDLQDTISKKFTVV